MISSFAKIIRLMSSDIEPAQLSLGICLGFVLGLSPAISIQALLAVVLLIILRANLSVLMLSAGLISIIAYLLDPLLLQLGSAVLSVAELNSLFSWMYNNSFWYLLRFNNTLNMGSLVISLAAFIPLFLLSNFLIKRYRVAIEKHWKSSRLFQYISQSKLLGKLTAVAERVS
ncbi:MAG: TIGR03546 family protein [Gammaproteobacteria bacterium]|nr:TIGR03546 family protein [Gammaproteobacteria bacterium]